MNNLKELALSKIIVTLLSITALLVRILGSKMILDSVIGYRHIKQLKGWMRRLRII